MFRWFEDNAQSIGRTPLVRLNRVGVGAGARGTGGAVGGAQTGYLRSYALAIAAGVAVLVVVFVSVQ